MHPNQHPNQNPDFIDRHQRSLALIASTVILAFGAGAAKFVGENDKHDSRLHAAQKQEDRAVNGTLSAEFDLGLLRDDVKEGTFQGAVDYFEESTLPDYTVDGKVLGKQVPYTLDIPEHISQKERDRVRALGAPFSKQEIKAAQAYAKANGVTFDPKKYVKVDAHMVGEGISWADDSQMEKFKRLCAELDRADREALPGYKNVVVQRQKAQLQARDALISARESTNFWIR